MFSLFDLLVLARIPALGPNRFRALIHHCGGPSGVLRASPGDLATVPGMGVERALAAWRVLHDPAGAASRFAEAQLRAVERSGARVVTCWDAAYPELLSRIYDPPALLYVRGTLTLVDRFALAIVGTRRPSPYGIAEATGFSSSCARSGLCVVSGLARGIDTAAHKAALGSGGWTVAVVGSGLDVAYPPENATLADEIVCHGAVISEYPMGARPEAANFPRRNRIISGLALGTLVVESDLIGGAMITARLALDQNREVFAVPGPARVRTSLGCNALIRDGRAKLVEDIADILQELTSALAPGGAAEGPFPSPAAAGAQPSLFDPPEPS